MKEILLIIIFVVLCDATILKSVAQDLLGDDKVTITINELVLNDNFVTDFAPIGAQEFRQTSCGISSSYIYYSLSNNSYSSCYNGSSYTDFVHPLWKMLSCNLTDDGIEVYISADVSIKLLEGCLVDSYSVPRFKNGESLYGYQIVLEEYSFGYNSLITLDADIHYDLQPSYAYVLGTNYVLSGPIFHDTMSYINVLQWNVFSSNDLSSIIGTYSPQDIKISQDSYLSYIPNNKTRTYSGSTYFLNPSVGITSIDNPLGKMNNRITLRERYDKRVEPSEFVLFNNNTQLTMTSLQYISTCQQFPKVLVSNGYWSLSASNYDKCERYQMNLTDEISLNYRVSNHTQLMIVSSDGINFDYISSIYGAQLSVNNNTVDYDGSVKVRFNLTISLLNTRIQICNLTKNYYKDDVVFAWKNEYYNKDNLLSIEFSFGSKYTLEKALSFMDDSYKLSMCYPFNGDIQLRPFKGINGKELTKTTIDKLINNNASSNKITILFVSIVSPLLLVSVATFYGFIMFRTRKYRYHVQ